MSLFHALVLGLVQGLSEFLPISSSAHLALLPWIFGWDEPGLAFDVALHVGTLVAVLAYFRDEWGRLIVAAWEVLRTRRLTTVEQRRVLYLLIATIPGGVGGLLLEKQAESTFRSPVLIALMLIVMGAVLWLVDRYASQRRSLDAIGARDAILIGVAQVAALIPGVSRSGATITAGRALSIDRPGAATFSFLMSMPIIAAASVLKVPGLIRMHGVTGATIVGVLAAAASGWFAIATLLPYVSHRSYGIFAIYRFALGVAVLLLAASRA